jgi:hypothetical protein
MFVLHDRKKGFIEVPGTGSHWVKDQCRHRSDYEKIDSCDGFDDYQWHMVVASPAERFYWLWHHRYRAYVGTKHRGDTVRIAPELECVEAVFADWDLFRVWFIKHTVPSHGEWQCQQHWNRPGKIRLWRVNERFELAEHLTGSRPPADPAELPLLPESYTEEQQAEIQKIYDMDHLLVVAHRVQDHTAR